VPRLSKTRAQPTALRARIDGHTRIEVGSAATVTVTHPRGG